MLRPPLTICMAGELPRARPAARSYEERRGCHRTAEASLVSPISRAARSARVNRPSRVLLCRDCRRRRCACCRSDPRRAASTPDCRARGRAATVLDARIAAGRDDFQGSRGRAGGDGARCSAAFPNGSLRDVISAFCSSGREPSLWWGMGSARGALQRWWIRRRPGSMSPVAGGSSATSSVRSGL